MQPTPPPDPVVDLPRGEGEPLILDGRPMVVAGEIPIADDWLSEEELAHVRRCLDARFQCMGPGTLTLVDDLFTRLGL